MKIIVDNIATEYKDEGAGSVLLFLHGWKNDLRSFDEIVPFLGSWRIVRLDLPGFGESEMPPSDWTVSDYAGFVRDFIAKLGVKPHAIIGHSLGGRITIKGEAERILSPEKIILIASAGVAERKTFRNFLLTALAKIGNILLSIPPFSFWKQTLREKFYKKIGSDYASTGALRQTFQNVIREDLGSSAQKISVPTLLIWGENDTSTPLSEGRRLASLITGSKLDVIPGAGHFVHREKPREVAELIKQFLS